MYVVVCVCVCVCVVAVREIFLPEVTGFHLAFGVFQGSLPSKGTISVSDENALS